MTPDADVTQLLAVVEGMNVRSVEEARLLLYELQARAEHLASQHVLPETDPFQPASTWIDDPEFFGGTNLRPAIREHFVNIFDDKYMGALCMWGKGGGKSYMAGVAIARMTYEVLVGIRDGWFYEGNELEPGTLINIPVLSIKAEQAKKVVFRYAQQFIENAPWFSSQFELVPTAGKLKFLDYAGEEIPLEVHAATSEDRGVLGEALYGYVLDEFDFFPETVTEAGLRRAEDLDLLAFTQMLTRCPRHHGKAVRITSPSWSGGVAMTWIEEATKTSDERLYVSRASAWELDGSEHVNWKPYCEPPIEVPERYWAAFDRDPEQSKRHIGAMPSAALAPFDGLAEKIMGGVGGATPPEPPPPDGRGPDPEHLDPVVYVGEGDDETPIIGIADWFQPIPHAEYFVHFDYSTTSNATGIGMAHCDFDPYALEGADDKIRVVVDIAARVTPQEVGGRISFERCRQLVYHLRARGFNIALVSTDGFESEDTRQLLSTQGITTALVSVDKKIEPYGTLKGLIHARKLQYGDTYWLREYRHLELKLGKKVEHPVNGSKDVADSVAGCTYMASLHGRQIVSTDVTGGGAADEASAARAEDTKKMLDGVLADGLKNLEDLRKRMPI